MRGGRVVGGGGDGGGGAGVGGVGAPVLRGVAVVATQTRGGRVTATNVE